MSTTSSTLTSVLSALGGSNGIDVTSAVNAILYADRAPERGWQTQQTALSAQTSAINQIQTEASSLSDALNALNTFQGVLSAATTTTSNSNVVTATAADGASSGSHLITVTNLAATGSWYSDAQTSSSATLPSGSFQITVGSGSPVTINVGSDSTNSTLDELAASINSQGLGVTANVVTDSTGARLSLVSSTSGAASDFTVSNDTSVAFTRANTGKDASLTVDGVPITSASNTVSGALAGVTLNLVGASAGSEVSVNVSPDTSSVSQAVSTFVTAYNTLISDVNSNLSYNTTTQVAGTLQGDSTIQGLQQQLLAATNYNTGGTSANTLTALGITTNSDGTLSLNTTTLATAVSTNSAAVTNFFQGSAFNGFISSFNIALNTYTDPSQGAFTVDLQSIASENSDLTNETSTLELYLTSQQTILTAQYNAADIAIQQLPEKLKQIQALLNPNSTDSSS